MVSRSRRSAGVSISRRVTCHAPPDLPRRAAASLEKGRVRVRDQLLFGLPWSTLTLTAPIEAESGLLTLRLACSPHESLPVPLLKPTLVRYMLNRQFTW